MEIRPWGTRGSIPSPGPSTARYGGNTSSVEVRLRDGTLIIIDAGSGIRPLGAALGPCSATLLLTHYHWDHIQGLPFFSSGYSPESSIKLFGPEFEGRSPAEVLCGQMVNPYFPAAMTELRGITSYKATPRQPFQVGSATVRVARLCHPSVTFGYRIEDDDGVFVYMSDNEVDMAPPHLFADIVELASGADLLLHDCQYTESEYAPRRGWGHSTPRQAAHVAREAGVRRLMAFHHDPSHSDEQVEALAEETRELVGDIEVIIGREGALTAVGQPARKL
jgi:phosphoribosyl 1,2-cyclic phosphodiesterase